MIDQDSISRALTVLAVLICIYLSTYETSAIILFPAILLISGIMLQFYLLRKVETVNHVAESAGNIGFYTLIALAGMALGGLVCPALARAVPMQKMQLTGSDAIMYSILIVVAEENFFRGAITNFLFTMLPPMPALMGGAAIFTVYHLAIYGIGVSVLLYVLVGGIVLGWVGYRSGRLSPCVLSHILNNVLSFMR